MWLYLFLFLYGFLYTLIPSLSLPLRSLPTLTPDPFLLSFPPSVLYCNVLYRTVRAVGCTQCIMVGDPQQLPAVIFSDTAKRAGYGTSLFERLSLAGHSSVMLNKQYRMDPIIR